MGSLTVDLNALGDVTEKFKDLIERSNIILNDFNSQKNCIDFDIAERDNIRYDLNEVSKKLKSISEIFITYDRQINDAIDTYADTEEKLKSFILELNTSDRKESTNNNAKPADVTVGKVKVRDSKVTDGVTTGYLVDIIEGLGGTAEWDGKTRTTTVKLNGKTIVYDLKNMKDGVGHASDGTTFTVKDGHIHVGVREVSEKSGANIKWSPNSKGGVTVDINYTYASVSKVTPITKDNGDYGELWVGDDIVILEQEGNRSHIRYPGKYHQETAWVDNDKLNIGVRVEKPTYKDIEFSDLDKVMLPYANGKVLPLTDEQKQAIMKIKNTYHNNDYIKKHKNDTQIYLFEGTTINKKAIYGNTKHTSLYEDRYGALLVIVKDDKIAYITPEASTLPDNPKGPKSMNGGTDMPTVVDGIYLYEDVIHSTKSIKYPALKIKSTDGKNNVKVARYNNKADKWYNGISTGIHFHMGHRGADCKEKEIDGSSNWANSAGCQIVRPGTINREWTRYNEIAKIIGFDKDGHVKRGEKPDDAKGIIVIDRSFMDLNENGYKEVIGEKGIDYIKKGVH
ncbi:hypothetical protein SH1V18_26740 [Vallitalea longa]|uniref:Copper amine oxidase-like N-terminal domain-containing protein n=1 Tax=Vallitalea longa TaxID=2936439 RepID=A0A9W5YBR3_9FIRM|nr:stalk domain-containing protein [Vallitalea longa]GKX30194.1 hypothetical protein SH1V18_26740 [Vallitalea longa]